MCMLRSLNLLPFDWLCPCSCVYLSFFSLRMVFLQGEREVSGWRRFKSQTLENSLWSQINYSFFYQLSMTKP